MTQTTLKCRHNVAGSILIVLGVLFLVMGCASWYEKAGIEPDKAQEQAALDQAQLSEASAEAVAAFQAGLAAGQDIPTAAISAGSALVWKIATIAGSGLGAVLSGLLARWLGTERKITRAMINGIEKGGKPAVKQAVKAEAESLGVESSLHKRVVALVGV